MNATTTTLSTLTRYESGHYARHYGPLYEEGVVALKADFPHIANWAACQVPRRWAQLLVAERDAAVESPHPALRASLTMTGRLVACPQDDTFVIVGLEKPHAESGFCTDPDFFGGCVWHAL